MNKKIVITFAIAVFALLVGLGLYIAHVNRQETITAEQAEKTQEKIKAEETKEDSETPVQQGQKSLSEQIEKEVENAGKSAMVNEEEYLKLTNQDLKKIEEAHEEEIENTGKHDDNSRTENNAAHSNNDKDISHENKNLNEKKENTEKAVKTEKKENIKAVQQEEQNQQKRLDLPKAQTPASQEDKQNTQKEVKEYTSSESENAQKNTQQDDNKDTQKSENGSDIIVNRMPVIGNSEQVIIVSVPSANSYKATLNAYEKINGNWQVVFSNIPAVVGRNGVNKQKEGDGKSPTGIFSFGTAFGTEKKPAGVKMPYRQTTDYDYWIDDVNSPDYNTWVTYEGNPKERWNSFEKLKISAYKYAVVINYNVTNIQPGKGSAIFLHVWQGQNKPTSGCTAISEANMLKILKWLDPNKKPIIIQGTQSWINSQGSTSFLSDFNKFIIRFGFNCTKKTIIQRFYCFCS